MSEHAADARRKEWDRDYELQRRHDAQIDQQREIAAENALLPPNPALTPAMHSDATLAARNAVRRIERRMKARRRGLDERQVRLLMSPTAPLFWGARPKLSPEERKDALLRAEKMLADPRYENLHAEIKRIVAAL